MKPKPPRRPDAPFLALAKLEYASAGIIPWNNGQVARLCGLLACTVRELGCLVGVFERDKLQRWERADSWPLEVSLQFHKLRRFRLGLGDPDAADCMTARVMARTL